jgi:4-nitrophenyl phosphatase
MLKQGLLIDLDGTIYKGNQMVERADEFVIRLKERGIPFLFVTNNSSRTPEAVAEHLRGMGIQAEREDVYTAAQAAAQYITEQNKGRKAAVIGESGLHQALIEAGLEITADERPDFVVQGIDRQFTYEKLKLAVGQIREGASYILTNPDLLLPSDGGLIPGAGSISAAIQAASQVQPVVIGKPSTIIMNYAMERMDLLPENVWVIGDNMLTDIGAGKAAGCKTALVLTGITTRENLPEMIERAGFEADVVCGDLIDFLELL